MSSPNRQRLLDLATWAAEKFHDHASGRGGTRQYFGHKGRFWECQHPDCVLVREAEKVSEKNHE